MTFSNSYTMEAGLGWSGMCVEPLPGPFAALQRARSCIAVNACAYNTTGSVLFQQITGYSEMISGIVESYDASHLARLEYELGPANGVLGSPSTSTIVDVATVRLGDLLRAHVRERVSCVCACVLLALQEVLYTESPTKYC